MTWISGLSIGRGLLEHATWVKNIRPLSSVTAITAGVWIGVLPTNKPVVVGLSKMVWKINKHKKSERQGRISNTTPVLESQPNLKSCLKTTNELPKRRDSLTDSSKLFDDAKFSQSREQSAKSNGSRGARSSNSNFSVGVDSKESGNSSLSFTIRRRVSSVEHNSVSSRSWDRESRKSGTAQSLQTSERSSADSRSNFEEPKKRVHFASIFVRDYERVVGDNPSCTIGPPVG